MGVAVGSSPSKGGSGPSSPNSFVSRLSRSSSVGSNDSEKTKKEKPQPMVDAMSMPKVESHGPEIRPNDERKLETKLVQVAGQTPAVNPSAPCVGPQYMPPMPQLYYQQPNYVTYNHDNKISDLQDQLSEKNQIITELKMKLENKKGEVSAKDDSLREKEAELATCRRNLDHCETEKHQLQEMHRVAQGSIICDNEQLKMELARCAAWSHGQSITIQSLQAELGARTVQYNQLLFTHRRQVGRNRQLAQQLQDEMANSRERSQTHPVESRIPQNNPQDVTQLGQNNRSQQDVNGGDSMNTSSGVLPNGNTDNATSFVSSGNASTQAGFLLIIVMFYIFKWSLHNCSGGKFSYKQFKMEMAALAVTQISAPSQTDRDLTRSDAKYEHDTSVDGQALHSSHLDVHINPETEPDSVISPSAGEEQVLSQENDTNTISICWGSTGLTSEIRLDTIGQNSDAKEQENVNLTDHGLQEEVASFNADAEVKEPSFNADASGSQ